MNNILLILSMVLGLIPFNRLSNASNALLDYALMLIVPGCYYACYSLVNFGPFGVYQLPTCDSICHLGNNLHMHLGCFLYTSVIFLTLLRGKRFFFEFQNCLHEIDEMLMKCEAVVDEKKKAAPKTRHLYYATWGIAIGVFSYAIFYDVTSLLPYYQKMVFISTMVTTFPFFAGSIVQGQFIYYVSIISGRFEKINALFEKINQECHEKNSRIAIFDIDSEMKKEPSKISSIVIQDKKKEKEISGGLAEISTSESDDDDDFEKDEAPTRVLSSTTTSESNLPDLFCLHDKILSLSVITNAEFGAQCVPYMAACFILTIFGIFLETKVIFIVGGKSHLLDYVAVMYIIWSFTTMFVAYVILRLCCNTNGHSKRSAMIVHEIMQKKPAFMLGNDLFYNKMKSFTLQFLHWESYFHFNGIGLFALDYTFIFSTVSAATSYLIVLLQFDMTAILKREELI